MKKYIYVIKMALMDIAAYPSGFFGNIFKDGVTLLIYIFLWSSLYGNKSEVMGYTLSGIITYYAISFTIRAIVNTRSITREVENGVRYGQLSAMLLKPISFNLYVFFNKDIHNFVKILAPAGVVLFLTYQLNVFSPTQYALPFLVSLGLSVAISSLFHSMLGTMAFWLVNTWGIRSILGRIISLLSGSLIPLAFFPSWMLTLSSFLPFRHMVYTPIVIYLNQLTANEIYSSLSVQFVWVISLFILHRLTWSAGIKRFDAVGN